MEQYDITVNAAETVLAAILAVLLWVVLVWASKSLRGLLRGSQGYAGRDGSDGLDGMGIVAIECVSTTPEYHLLRFSLEQNHPSGGRLGKAVYVRLPRG